MGHLAIFALGPLRIELDGKPLQTSRHKALALLVYLAMHPEKQSREALSALLWPDYEQEKAYAYLRRTLWEIHNLLGDDWIDADREEIGFSENANLLLDVADFQSHLAAFQGHDHPASSDCPECIAHLHMAALLYRGDFLAGFSLRDSNNFEDWQFFQSEALRRDYASSLQKLVILLRLKGAFAEAAVFARRWLALDNLNEEAHRELMKTYSLNGERTLALRQYQECRRLLQTELGVAPEGTTTALYEQIQSGKRLLAQDQTPGKHDLNPQALTDTISRGSWMEERFPVREIVTGGILPAQTGPLIGRHKELAQITAQLADPDCWLLTLLGPGGIGKTRLAIEVGLKQQDHYSQGVFFVPFTGVLSDRAITPAIAKAAGLTFRQDGPSPEDQLLNFLREKELLLILDSFESLVESADLLGRIHSYAKGVKILVTSRHRLPLQGARVMEIMGLDYPQVNYGLKGDFQAYSAVELFLQAAQRAEVGFQMSETDLPAIAQITQLLEGMPLGLELAATWIKTLSCQEIADEITRSLDFLETTHQDLPDRQRSIRAIFDYSWDLLSGREKRLFSRLSVFQGRFTRSAAEQVAGLSLRELAGLVDKSLVQRPSAGRFILHDLLRQYGQERLDHSPEDSQETRSRHCAYYCARLAEWSAGLSGDKPGQVLNEIEADLENARAAWEWATLEGQVAWLEGAVDGLGLFFLRRGRFTEGLALCQEASAALEESTRTAPVNAVGPGEGTTDARKLRARLNIWQAAFSINLDNGPEAGAFLDESRSIIEGLELEGQPVAKERCFLLTIQGELALLSYNLSSSLELMEQYLLLARQSGIPVKWAVFYWRYLMRAGTSAAKEYRLFTENLPYIRSCGDPFETACTLYTIGVISAFWYYRIDEAEPLLKESIEIFRRLDDPVSQGMIYKTIWFLLLYQGKYTENLGSKLRELDIYQDLGDRLMIGIAQAEAAESLYHLGRYEEAETRIRTGLDLLKDLVDHEHALRHRYLGDALLAQGKIYEACEAYQFSYRFFQAVGEKTWMMTALTGLSRAELAQGDRSGAWEHAREAFRLFHEGGAYSYFFYLTLADFALLLADRGDINRALELYGLALCQPNLANSRWFGDLYSQVIDEAAQILPLQERAELISRGQKQDLSWAVETLLSGYA